MAVVDTKGSVASLSLTDVEMEQVDALAVELAETEPCHVDSPRWAGIARVLSCRLPARLIAAVRDFRHDSGPDAALLVRNLPVRPESLPPTPTVPLSVERSSTVAASAMALVMSQLGEPIAYREEKAGALVQNVVPVPGREEQQSNAGSVLLEMHTENAFHVNRPDYLGLLCLRIDHERQGRCSFSSIRHALPLLTEPARTVLFEERFMTEAPPSFGGANGLVPAHAVLTGALDDPDVRVDFTSTHPLDAEAAAAMTELREALAEVTVELTPRPGDLAIVDNRLAVHGRVPFVPRYDGNDRWLHRMFVHLDHRRSRAVRRDNGHVLD